MGNWGSMRLSHAGHQLTRQRQRQGVDQGVCTVKATLRPLHHAASVETRRRMLEGLQRWRKPREEWSGKIWRAMRREGRAGTYCGGSRCVRQKEVWVQGLSNWWWERKLGWEEPAKKVSGLRWIWVGKVSKVVSVTEERIRRVRPCGARPAYGSKSGTGSDYIHSKGKKKNPDWQSFSYSLYRKADY